MIKPRNRHAEYAAVTLIARAGAGIHALGDTGPIEISLAALSYALAEYLEDGPIPEDGERIFERSRFMQPGPDRDRAVAVLRRAADRLEK